MVGGTAQLPQSDGPNLLRLEGPVDVRVAKRFLQTAREHAATPADLVVDCAAVDRFDGSAVQILLALKAALATSGHSLGFQSIPESVLAFLAVSGALEALAIDPEAQRTASRAVDESVGAAGETPAEAASAIHEEATPVAEAETTSDAREETTTVAQEEATTPDPVPASEGGDADVDVESLFARGRRDD